MRAIEAKMTALYVMAVLKVQGFLKDEKGDTNFISILIILGVVIALATIFLNFKKQIVDEVTKAMDEFISKDF